MTGRTERTAVICYAGVGGLTLGVEQAGFRPEAVTEVEADCCSSLRANRPHWPVIASELCTIDLGGRVLPGVLDLLCATPPVTPFSLAAGLPDDGSDIMTSVFDLVAKLRPRAVLLDLVPAALMLRSSPQRDVIDRALNKLGYVAQLRMLDAVKFGVPIRRRRAFLVALSADDAQNFRWPAPYGSRRGYVGDTLRQSMAAQGWPGAEDWAANAQRAAPPLVCSAHGAGLTTSRARSATDSWASLGIDVSSLADQSPPPEFTGTPQLTVHQLSLLQAMPDNWTYMGSRDSAFRQMCRVTPPPLARAVATAIHDAIDRSDHPTPAVLLGARATTRCPRAIHNRYDPTVIAPARTVPDGVQLRFDQGSRFKRHVVTALLATHKDIADLRELHDDPATHTSATLRHLEAGTAVVIGGRLPDDPVCGRTGQPDLLLRATFSGSTRAGYRPVEIKWHKTRQPWPGGAARVSLARESTPLAARMLDGAMPLTRLDDLLQLAHYWRMLEACGFEATRPYAGILGTDDADGLHTITWHNLADPVLTSTAPDTSGAVSPLQRNDEEHEFRMNVAATATLTDDTGQRHPAVESIGQAECANCRWAAVCVDALPVDNLSNHLRANLSVREYVALGALGITTIDGLVAADASDLAAGQYGRDTARIPGNRRRLDNAIMKAGLAVNNLSVRLNTRTDDQPDLPSADVEIDIDVEWTPGNRVYLWGILRTEGGNTTYEKFDDDAIVWTHNSLQRMSDQDREFDLARVAMSWLGRELRTLTKQNKSAIVFHYSPAEPSHARRIRSTRPEAWDSAAHDARLSSWVDLLPFARARVDSIHGHGLKVLATEGAGFTWRDRNPGGDESQAWLDQAQDKGPAVRQTALERVLRYNEDDTRAASAVRTWLRSSD